MQTIIGYQLIEQLSQGKHYLVYRAKKEDGANKVVLKICRLEQPTVQELATLQHEYQLLSQLDAAGIAKANDLIKYHHQLILELVDINGITLKQYQDSKVLPLDIFFKLALQIIDALQALHLQNIIHKDINPSNIILDPHTLTLQLIDLGISSQLTQEVQALTPEHLEGTLAYLSPEQTGRMNCLVDYRTDFYSLGITFYEMLTGQLPFLTDDPLELIYSHLAKIPKQITELNPALPKMLAAIVTKLMAKLPGERYASAGGLKADLALCQQQWLNQHHIDHFILAQQDYSEHLNLSPKLYGREAAIQLLIDAFTRISRGPSELLLIAGYSGIGKTSLVKEIYKPITQQRGYFLSGKYDQLQRTTPYSAIIEAFQDLANRLLAAPPIELAQVKDRLLAALGNNAQVIINVIPLLGVILGEQPAVQELPTEQAHTRFVFTFQNFVRALAQPAHPLALFLDDLQWADRASLDLIGQLLTGDNLQYFLLLGSYRDNEVSRDHPLMLMIETLQKGEINVSTIELTPLPLPAIKELLTDSLNGAEGTAELAELIFHKAQGNPFFTNEFIKMLYQQRLLKFSREQRCWQWDIKRIDEQTVMDNVVDLLLNRLRELPAQAQSMISLAACMGHTFDLESLARISEQDLSTTAQRLWPLIIARFIRPLGNNYQISSTGLDVKDLTEKISYQFVHDRIQQAAYKLISAADTQKIHLNIGRLLLKDRQLEEHDAQLFEILNQFNHSLDLITDAEERLLLARYNLWAGRKARYSNAYQAALNYLKAGIDLLSVVSWQQHYPLLFEHYKMFAECSFLSGDYATADDAIALLLNKANNEVDITEIYIIKLGMLNTQNKQRAALDIGIHALKKLGLTIPKKTKLWHLLVAMLENKWLIGRRPIASLELVAMNNPKYIIIDKLLVAMINIAYFIDQNLFGLLIFKVAKLNIQYGYTENSPFAFAANAVISLHSLNHYQEGISFGALSEKIGKQLSTASAICRQQYVLGAFVKIHSQSMAISFDYIKRGYQLCIDSGDFSYALYSLYAIALQSIAAGKPLAEVNMALLNTISFKERVINEEFDSCIKVFLTIVQLLQGNSLDRQTLFEIPHDAHNTDIAIIYNYAIIYHYLAGNFTQALNECVINETYLVYILGQINYMQNQFFYALTLAANYADATVKEQKRYIKKLYSLQKQLTRWATWCPANFLHYSSLIRAEISRLTKPSLQTGRLYDLAIKEAYAQENLLIIAIANECAARFYFGVEQPHIAKFYIQAAHYAFAQWGAIAKCKALEASYPDWLQDEAFESRAFTVTGTKNNSSATTTNANFDVLSILKSAQAISSEIQLDKLLQKLLYLVLENAGAERGMLLMEKNGRWLVKAEGTIALQQVYLEQAEMINVRRDIPLSLIQFVQRSEQQLLLQDPHDFERYAADDSYLEAVKPQSILILPVLYQNKLTYLFYLENKVISCAFTPAQIQTLHLLASQAAISLENAQLYYQATHDALTGLSNRNLLYPMFHQARAKAKRKHTQIAILFLDLDGFKKINDTLGHEAGDQVLLFITHELKSCLREHDLAARLGGDEFIVMLDELTDKEQAAKFAERFLTRLQSGMLLNGQRIALSSSIGISMYPQHGEDIQVLLSQADAALYQVKKTGKNHYQFYASDNGSI